MLRTVITTACLCASGLALAQGTRLSGPELQDLVSGATVEINAPLGYKLPVRYGADGHVSGEAGGLASYLGAAVDTGRWWVKGELLCHKWKQWFSGETKCLRIARAGRTIHWTSQEGDTGTADIIAQAPPPRITAAAAAALMPSFSVLPGRAAPPPAVPTLPALTPPQPKPVRSGVLAPAPAAAPAMPAPEAPLPTAAPAQPERKSAAALPATRPAPPPSAKVPAEPAFRVVNIGADDVLNMRSGPSTEHAVVATLRADSRGISIVGDCQADWCPVQHTLGAGWVNRAYLRGETEIGTAFPPQRADSAPEERSLTAVRARLGDSPEAPRSCLTAAARRLLARIEERFGPVRTVSTCRAGATIAGTGRPSRHAGGNAIDFNAGARKAEVLRWLIATHREGGVMTYPDMDHIHVDIGPHFVSIAGGEHWATWRGNTPRGRAEGSEDD
ncbi:MAG: SH3 domain-containing protein [Hyphomicrobiaceae bacterium]|nr:SH3 domain-containing protein [Hyphomicrobiaceae bacterium]